MTVSQADADQHSARNAAIVALAAQQTAQLWPQVDWTNPDAADAIKTLYGAIVARYGQASAAVAAQFYDELRQREELPTHYMAAPADTVPQTQIDRIVDSAFLGNTLPGNAADELHVAAHADDHELRSASASQVRITHAGNAQSTGHVLVTSDLPIDQRVPARLDGALQRLVLQPSRDTIAQNVADDPAKPIGWARVTTSDHPCAFCVLMASRTYGKGLYRSKKSATRVVVRGRFVPDDDATNRNRAANEKPGWRWEVGARGNQALGEKYHKECGCIAVPVFKQVPPSVGDNREMYEKAAANAGKGDLKSILASMRQIYGVR